MWCGRLETYRVQPKGASTWLVRPVLVPIPLRDTSSPVPDEAEELLDELTAMLPRIPLAALLIELDRRTGFTDHLAHASGRQIRSPQLKRNLIACLIAQATDMGLVAMSEASGIPYDVLAVTTEWYIREDTCRCP